VSDRVDIEFQRSPSLARQAFRVYMWRRQAGWFIGSVGAAVGCVVWGLSDRPSRPLSLFILGFLSFWWMSWLLGYRAAGRTSRAAKRFGGPLRLLASEDGVTLQATYGSSTTAWSAIGALFQSPHFWFLVRFDGAVVTIPVAALDPAARQFIEANVRSAGAKIR
jgi:hypothetical protein